MALLMCRLTGGQAATAVHSYTGAVWLVLAALATEQEVLVSRAELGDIDPGCPLSQLAASTGVVIREVGTTNRTTAEDYESAARELLERAARRLPCGTPLGLATQRSSFVVWDAERGTPLLSLISWLESEGEKAT